MKAQYEITKQEAILKLRCRIAECKELTTKTKRYKVSEDTNINGDRSVLIATTNGVDVSYSTYSDGEYSEPNISNLCELLMGATLTRLSNELEMLNSCDVKSLYVGGSYISFISETIKPQKTTGWEEVSDADYKCLVSEITSKKHKKTTAIRERQIEKINLHRKKKKKEEDIVFWLTLTVTSLSIAVLFLSFLMG